jgi:hypothetical protein
MTPVEQPWFILTRHFIQRYFEPDVEAPSGELRTGIAALLGLSVTPGLVLCALLFEKYSTLAGWLKGILQIDRDITSVPDKYLFMAMAFTVSGLVTVLRWETLFPDRKDYMILAVLPVRPATIFLSKLIALSLSILSFSVAVNLMGTVFFPAVVLGNTGTLASLIRYGLSHSVSAIAASAAGALLVIVAAGILLNVAPARLVRRYSSWLQFALFVFFVSQILLAIDVANHLPAFRQPEPSWKAYLFPPLWFVGLYQQLLGNSAANMPDWAERARLALAGGFAAAAILYLVSYFRHFRQTAESNGIAVVPGKMLRLLPIAGDPLEAAISEFVRQTISRSGLHRLLFRIFLGAGCAVILQGIASRFVIASWPTESLGPLVLAAPLVISYFLLAGLRVLIDVPVQHPAAWVFRLLVPSSASAVIFRGVRRVMFELGIVAWLIATVPLNLLLLGPTLGLAHSVFCLLIGLIFLDVLLFRYCRLPFTSALDGGRVNLGLAAAVWVSLFGLYAYGTTYIEVGLLARPITFTGSLVVLYVAWRLIIHARENHAEQALEFSDGAAPAVLTLDLQGK